MRPPVQFAKVAPSDRTFTASRMLCKCYKLRFDPFGLSLAFSLPPLALEFPRLFNGFSGPPRYNQLLVNVQFVSRFIVRTAAFFGCMIVVFGPESAGAFEIESFNVSNQIREVSFPTDTNNYYTLLTGAIVTNINQPVAMMVGTGDTGVLRDTNAPAQTGFYRVRALPAA